MHELHIVDNLMHDVFTKAEEVECKKIVAINIALGADSRINDENLKFLIGLKCKATLAENAEINVKPKEGRGVSLESIDVE